MRGWLGCGLRESREGAAGGGLLGGRAVSVVVLCPDLARPVTRKGTATIVSSAFMRGAGSEVARDMSLGGLLKGGEY